MPKLNIPMGVEWTDELLMKVADVTGKAIPESLAKERGRLVDMMTDSHTWLHGKKIRPLRRSRTSCMGMTQVPAGTGRRADPHRSATTAARSGTKAMKKVLDDLALRRELQGLSRRRPVAHALAVLHRQAGLPDRQQLRQVHPARHPAQGQGVRSAADPHRLPDLRPPSPAPP